MESLTTNKDLVLYISIPITVIILILSVIYTLRNILRIWETGKPKPAEVLHESDEEKEESLTDEEKEDKASVDKQSHVDPVQYCEHIQSEVKKARQRVTTRQMQQNLTDEDLEKEKEIQRKQIEDIFKLMEQHSDKFGNASKDDIQQQMKLYV